MTQALGAAIGAGIGLIAVLLAALFNAHLQRRRDRLLRQEQTRSLAAALFADLEGAIFVLDHMLIALQSADERSPDYNHAERLALPPMACIDLAPVALQHLPIDAARLTVLALRSYEVAGMLLRLSATELAAGNRENLPIRLVLLRQAMQAHHRAMVALATVAGLASELRHVEDMFPAALEASGS